MAAKDYYAILNIKRDADEKEINVPTGNLPKNIIPTPTLIIKKRNRNSKKSQKPIPS